MSVTKELIQTYPKWADDLQAYNTDKKTMKFEIKAPKIVKEREVKLRDQIYNPILQKFNNLDVEKSKKIQDNEIIKNKISENKDKQLRVEQVHDLITHKNRLGPLESLDKNFGQAPKVEFKNTAMTSKARAKTSKANQRDINIISLKSLKEHHYDKPENRPDILKVDNKTQYIKKNVFKEKNSGRDYNIITGKYPVNHEEKIDIEKKIGVLNSAQQYWKFRDYDLVKGTYYDKEKEINYQNKEKQRANSHYHRSVNRNIESKFKCFHGEGTYYNPVNREVTNQEWLNKEIEKKNNSQLTYKVKYNVEDHLKVKENNFYIKNKKSSLTKVSARRFEEEDNRSFNPLNNKERFDNEYYKKLIKANDKLSNWDKIVSKVGEKNTISNKKNLYCNPYDSSDVMNNRKEFYTNRMENIIPSLGNFKEECGVPLNKKVALFNNTANNFHINSNKTGNLDNVSKLSGFGCGTTNSNKFLINHFNKIKSNDYQTNYTDFPNNYNRINSCKNRPLLISDCNKENWFKSNKNNNFDEKKF